jgi:copper chaperone CopZ
MKTEAHWRPILSLIDPSQIIQTIEEAGYSAQIIEDGNYNSHQIPTRDPSSSTCPVLSPDQCINNNNPKLISSKLNQQRVTLSLSGMHCASCAALIERSLNKKNGVIRATVNFAAEKATVLFDQSVTNPTELIDVVKKAGYDARVITPEDREKETNGNAKKSWHNGVFPDQPFSKFTNDVFHVS